MDTVMVTIDGAEYEVEKGLTLIQACMANGIEIPHFCYHERLNIAGNCRMCLVELEKAPKPVASCAQTVSDGMVVHTRSEAAEAARKGVMEFLLINHPLDCPICDQGGECDLQDQSMYYGLGSSRYAENKRAVQDKDMGPLIRTHMTRCIHCTRCIRFATEVAGVPELGALYRGEEMQITTYLEKAMTSELSANVIDLCPVGALTSKPYAFVARPWELRKTESVDVMDAVGSNIRVDSRHREVLRVLPRLHEDINEEWISDKTRYACDGLKRRRLDKPFVRQDGRLRPVTWMEAFKVVADRMKVTAPQQVAALAGDLMDAEAQFALKRLMTALGSPHTDCRQDGAALDPTNRAGWLFNTTIAGIEDADAILLIGSNPRAEAALVNARIRKRYLRGGLMVGRIGPHVDLAYRVQHLGDGPAALAAVADGEGDFAQAFRAAQRPMVILGMGALTRPDAPAILGAVDRLVEAAGVVTEAWNGFNVLHTAAGRVGGLEAGFVPDAQAGGLATREIVAAAGRGEITVVYLLGADEVDMTALGDAFVIYQGHHGDAGAHRADVILPAAAYTEKPGIYVNTEGRAQEGRAAHFPLGEAREDWKVIRALSEILGHTLPFNSLEHLRGQMAAANPVFGVLDQILPAEWRGVGDRNAAMDTATPFAYPVADFYRTDPISRASETMAAVVAAIAGNTAGRGQQEATGTDG